MPKRYEAIRDSIHMRNPQMPMPAVKTSAAKIFNASRKRGEKPVTGKHSKSNRSST